MPSVRIRLPPPTKGRQALAPFPFPHLPQGGFFFAVEALQSFSLWQCNFPWPICVIHCRAFKLVFPGCSGCFQSQTAILRISPKHVLNFVAGASRFGADIGDRRGTFIVYLLESPHFTHSPPVQASPVQASSDSPGVIRPSATRPGVLWQKRLASVQSESPGQCPQNGVGNWSNRVLNTVAGLVT